MSPRQVEVSKKKQGLIIAVLGFVLVVVIGAILLNIMNPSEIDGQKVFYKNTFVNEIDVSKLNAEQVKKLIEAKDEDIEFVVKNSRKTQMVLGSSFNYKEEPKEKIEDIIEKQPITRKFSGLFNKQRHILETEASFDENKLKNVAQTFADEFCKDATLSKNATIERVGNEFKIVDEVYGNEVDKELLYTKLKNSIELKEYSIDIEGAEVYKIPEILRKDLENNSIIDELNKIINLKIVFDFQYTTEEITQDQLESWLVFDGSSETYTFNEEEIGKYVALLAQKYDTYQTNRNFRSSNGYDVVVGGGIYGWRIDQTLTIKNLIERIKTLQSGTYTPDYRSYGLVRKEGNVDIGNTYIEVDLTSQNLWFYKDGELVVDTPIVSGLSGTDRETPTGVFAVWTKEKNRYLSGDDYKLWVDFWLPIDWTGVGIHDATWQTSFGGDRYLVYGSHGCLNTPYDEIAKIYENVEIDTPVIIYKG